MHPGSLAFPLILALLSSAGKDADPGLPADSASAIAGALAPAGPPLAPPVRIAAGRRCIVDLVQAYEVTGDLAGRFEIDFRILVDGPCGKPPGTFSEQWIAHGSFSGSLREAPVSARLSYFGTGRVGGEVEAQMVFDQGMEGELRVRGNFGDGKLSYRGGVH